MKLLTIALIALLAAAAAAQTNEFTYQGNLTVGGAPANGSFDFEFLLFTASSGGAQVGSVNTATAVPVTNGVFAVKLNFGNAFPGSNRYLEIRVRPAATGSYTVLSPRPQITSEPYAMNAAQLGGVAASQYLTSGAATIAAGTQFNLGSSRILSAGGTANTYLGIGAGANANALSENNAIFGTNAGASMVVGGGNSFFGSDAGSSATSGGDSFFGFQAGRLTTTGGSNSFFGNGSGRANTTGSNNSFFGRAAGTNNQTGSGNAFFGYQAGLSSNTSNNSFFGFQAGKDTTGINNSFFGWSTGTATTTGTNNSFFGVQAGLSNTTGSRNVFIGRDAGVTSVGGDENVFIGYRAGNTNVNGSHLTLIGQDADVTGTGIVSSTAIGANATVTGSHQIVLGTADETIITKGTLRADGNVTFLGSDVRLGPARNVFYSSRSLPGGPHVCFDFDPNALGFYFGECGSSIRLKNNVRDLTRGLALVQKLRPVMFDWKSNGRTSLGLIAEEVNAVEPVLANKDPQTGEVNSVNFDGVTAVLLHAVKEQQTLIEELTKKVALLTESKKEQDERLDAQQSEIDELKKLVCLANSTAGVCKPQEPK